jgi:hypothetical protein
MPRLQFSLTTILWSIAVVVAFFAGSNFNWRERDALKRDLNLERAVVRNIKESNSHLAERFNEANEAAKEAVEYHGVPIQRTTPAEHSPFRPRRYSFFINCVTFQSETFDEVIAAIDRMRRLQDEWNGTKQPIDSSDSRATGMIMPSAQE